MSRFKNSILLGGYFREMEKHLHQDIPIEIQEIIKLYQNIAMILGIGSNAFGQLGLPDFPENCKEFTEIQQLQELNISHHNVYPNHLALMIITDNNQLYISGSNMQNKLGFDQYETVIKEIKKFTKMPLNEAIKFASHGTYAERHSFMYTTTNKLYVSGCNYSGQLGIADGEGYQSFSDSVVLKEIPTNWLKFGEYIIDIACSAVCSLFLTDKGNVYSCGDAETHGHGQDKGPIFKPELLDMNNGNIAIIRMCCGKRHSLLLDEYHRLITFGINDYGETNSFRKLKVIDKPTFHPYFKDENIKIKLINGARQASLCIGTNGGCYLFGYCCPGKLGDGNEGYQYVSKPVKVND